eukprot:CAMPEP_0184989572 /NCGR_PEP_ID=MMETSP1098-20130426/29063_1 /TAXON_ID=89044 /ORGANISM="Spumella elongata, Strain CCAP 955/1" /LENGTH=318 /DNA_ID=CAMNT_0027514601 /DNA_START=221 /DNA_END=1176 /DNA_ORIENTATION=+
MKSLCRLDSAICMKDKRSHFLTMIASNRATFSNTSPTTSAKESTANVINNKSFQWLTNRQLSIEHFNLCKEMDGITLEKHVPFATKIFRKLRSVSISAGPKLSESSLLVLTKQCQNLDSLSLNGFKKINELRVGQIVELSPQLKTLSLVGCWTVNDEDIQKVAQKCQKLESIDLSACFEITDEALVSIARHCSQLRTLVLQHCDKVTDKGICEIAKHCRMLRSINLSTCLGITDEGISSLALHSPQLQNADFSYLKEITDTSLTASDHTLQAAAEPAARGLYLVNQRRGGEDLPQVRQSDHPECKILRKGDKRGAGRV